MNEKLIAAAEWIIKSSRVEYDATNAGNGIVSPAALVALRNALLEIYRDKMQIKGMSE